MPGDWEFFVRRLKGLPDKRFIRGSYREGDSFCVIGAFIPDYAGEIEGESPVWGLRCLDPKNILQLEGEPIIEDDDLDLKARQVLWRILKAQTGLSIIELRDLQTWNDSFEGNAEERYRYVVRAATDRCHASRAGVDGPLQHAGRKA